MTSVEQKEDYPELSSRRPFVVATTLLVPEHY
jgi:hypothetical protein